MTQRELWLEKHRPNTLLKFVCDDDVRQRLETYMKTGNWPNLCFLGRHGTGKTTLAHIIANIVCGESIGMDFKELNASVYKKLSDMKSVVLNFMKSISWGSGGMRVLLLDEADRLEPSAQDGILRPIELYSGNCIVIITANDKDKLIEPLRSRCKVFEFTMAPKNHIIERLTQIAEEESMEISESELDRIARMANGDFREAINELQYEHDKLIA